MSISFATMAAAPHRQLPASPLNPVAAYAYHHAAARATTMQVCGAVDGTTLTTATHLSNLERLLQMQKEESHPPTAPCTYPTADVDDAGPNPGPQESPYSSLGSRLLNALNLPSSLFLPRSAKTQAEDMSPGSLNQFRRLLSNSNRASPRGSIASNWRQLHGADDWVGLLDPLDDNLRRELLRFGDFVQATYHAFHSNAVTHDRPRHVILSERSYRVTRNLFATSSVVLPPWVDSVAPWMVGTQPTSWIGYVAVCENEREIRRMGRRDIVIALRGTSTCLEWAENFRTGLVPIDDDGGDHSAKKHRANAPKVECGFRSLYKTPGHDTPSLSSAVVEELRRLTEQYAGEEVSVTLTGHSLGAALAVLAADEVAALGVPTAVFSFGGPRVGNRAFAERVEARGAKVLRVVNARDLVTRVPGMLPLPAAGGGGYAHVGRELLVDSRKSPYLRPDADPACCHDLEAYLHLVDGFMATDGPFRADAKRGLARLLRHQGGNVKQVYVSVARALRSQGAPTFCSSVHRVHSSLSIENVEVR